MILFCKNRRFINHFGVKMIVAVIGNEHFKLNASTTRRFNRKITKLVKRGGARIFLFTGDGSFDIFCRLFVSRLQREYSDIKRVYVRIKDEDDDPLQDNISLMFDSSFVIEEARAAGEMAESVRNKMMLEMCDALLTYFDTKKLRTTKGYAELAIEQAQEMKKQVFNLKNKFLKIK